MARTEFIDFNIGGTSFHVSKSLLDQYPESVLSRMTAPDWEDDSKEPVFIDRSGVMFDQVLSYMRDSKVTLPMTVSKTAFEEELVYYNIDAQADSVHLEFDRRDMALDLIYGYQKHLDVLEEECKKEVEAVQLASNKVEATKVAIFVLNRFRSQRKFPICILATDFLESSSTKKFLAGFTDHSEMINERLSPFAITVERCAKHYKATQSK